MRLPRPSAFLRALGFESAGGADPFFDPDAARARMVRDQLVARGISDEGVLAAMGRVPRHEFVPEPERVLAYEDGPLPIGFGQTISQPYVVAFMTAALAPRPGLRVLEVGTGSGYQAAVLSELGAEVYTVEIVEPLARRARELLGARSGVHVRHGDGYRGWPEAAPFDAILVTAAPDHVPAPLVEQLAEGGRMILPVGRSRQELVLLERRPEGLVEEAILPVRFVPMTGEAAEGGGRGPERTFSEGNPSGGGSSEP